MTFKKCNGLWNWNMKFKKTLEWLEQQLKVNNNSGK